MPNHGGRRGSADDSTRQRSARRLWRHYFPPAQGEARPEPPVDGPVPRKGRWATYRWARLPSTPPLRRTVSRTRSPYGAPPARRRPARSTGPVAGRGTVVVAVVLMFGAAAGITALYAFDDGDSSQQAHPAPAPPPVEEPGRQLGPPGWSAEGLAMIAEDLRQAQGSTLVSEVTFDGTDWAILEVPSEHPGHWDSYGWMRLGSRFVPTGGQSAGAGHPFDFRRIDATVVHRLVRRMERMVPGGGDVDVKAWRYEGDDPPTYVVTRQAEHVDGRIVATLAGKVTYHSVDRY